jgi:hypothetical protein
MSSIKFVDVHRTWEDWIGIGVGAVVGFSPWLSAEPTGDALMLLTMLIGLVVFSLSAFELVDLRRWEETGLLIAGLALIGLPFLLGYAGSGSLRNWHFGLGGLTCVLAVIELWQDWRLNAQELARHGQ